VDVLVGETHAIGFTTASECPLFAGTGFLGNSTGDYLITLKHVWKKTVTGK
jgi:hypothetical protein